MYEKLKRSTIFPDNLLSAIEVEATEDNKSLLERFMHTVQYRQKDGAALIEAYFRQNRKYKEIAKEYGLSVERIRQKIMLSVFDIRREFYKKGS